MEFTVMSRLVHNSEIAAMLEQLADLLEIEGANRFRVRRPICLQTG
jgi:DNA polymerase/3'-5' exonuclease PolX